MQRTINHLRARVRATLKTAIAAKLRNPSRTEQEQDRLESMQIQLRQLQKLKS